MTIRCTWLTGAVLVLLSSPALAQPGVATLNSPNGHVFGSTITFTWQSVATADQYELWVGKTDATLVADYWYTKEAAGCAFGATCHVTVTPRAWAGGFNWYIRAWSASGGYGAWSPAMTFTLNDPTQAWSGKLPASRRFTLVLDNQGVLDNETGLVWQQAPAATTYEWHQMNTPCVSLTSGGRRGWRTPTVSELTSITETTGSAPRLPAGHPFTVPATPSFWTTSQSYTPSSYRYVVDFATGDPIVVDGNTSPTYKVWCVRTGA
jgi:hypothetical protein